MKGVTQKCTLYALSFALSLTALSSVFSANVSAISDYDNVYTTTDKIEVGIKRESGDSNYGSCTDLANVGYTNYSQNYIQFFTDPDKWDIPQSQADMYQSFKNAQENGYWGVTQVDGDVGQGYIQKTFKIFWSENATATIDWYPTAAVVPNVQKTIYVQQFWNYPGFGNLCFPQPHKVKAFEQGNGQAIANPPSSSTKYRNFYLSGNVNPNYPSGYAGDPISSSANLSIPTHPDVVYTVRDKKLTATFLQQPKIEGSYVYWTIVDSDNNVIYEFPSNDDIDGTFVPPSGQIEYDFDDYGDYQLTAQFKQLPFPAPNMPNDRNYNVLRLPLKVDGSTYTSSAGMQNCDEEGNCEQPSPYEDCSQYGSDLIGALGCQFRNLALRIRNVLVGLFVPSTQFFKQYWNDLGNFLTSKLGFIYQSIASIVSLFTGLVTNAATPDCTYSFSGQFYGTGFSLNMCKFQQMFPSIFTVMQSLVVGVTVIGIYFGLQRKYHEVVDAR